MSHQYYKHGRAALLRASKRLQLISATGASGCCLTHWPKAGTLSAYCSCELRYERGLTVLRRERRDKSIGGENFPFTTFTVQYGRYRPALGTPPKWATLLSIRREWIPFTDVIWAGEKERLHHQMQAEIPPGNRHTGKPLLFASGVRSAHQAAAPAPEVPLRS